jgi:nicotinamidase-related amidase
MAAALLVIDVQQSLVEELVPDRRDRFLAVLRALLGNARAAAVPVVYVRHDGAPEELIPGTAGWHVAAEIAPEPGEPIVDKRFRDSFRGTNLAEVLDGLDADEVFICGMQTEFCVDATVREAERRGYRVTLIEDAHATSPGGGLSEEQIRAHVHRVARDKVARIVPSAQLFGSPAATSAAPVA